MWFAHIVIGFFWLSASGSKRRHGRHACHGSHRRHGRPFGLPTSSLATASHKRRHRDFLVGDATLNFSHRECGRFVF